MDQRTRSLSRTREEAVSEADDIFKQLCASDEGGKVQLNHIQRHLRIVSLLEYELRKIKPAQGLYNHKRLATFFRLFIKKYQIVDRSPPPSGEKRRVGRPRGKRNEIH